MLPLRWGEAVKKLGGRASWRAVAPASPCPMRLGGSLALPISAGLNFFTPSDYEALRWSEVKMSILEGVGWARKTVYLLIPSLVSTMAVAIIAVPAESKVETTKLPPA